MVAFVAYLHMVRIHCITRLKIEMNPTLLLCTLVTGSNYKNNPVHRTVK